MAAGPTKPGDLVKNADKYDGKDVTTAGVVAKFQARTSKIGNKYFVFDVKEGNAFVSVYGKGELKPAPSGGQRVQVTGKFEKEHKMRDFSIKNQITVNNEKDVKILK